MRVDPNERIGEVTIIPPQTADTSSTLQQDSVANARIPAPASEPSQGEACYLQQPEEEESPTDEDGLPRPRRRTQGLLHESKAPSSTASSSSLRRDLMPHERAELLRNLMTGTTTTDEMFAAATRFVERIGAPGMRWNQVILSTDDSGNLRARTIGTTLPKQFMQARMLEANWRQASAIDGLATLYNDRTTGLPVRTLAAPDAVRRTTPKPSPASAKGRSSGTPAKAQNAGPLAPPPSTTIRAIAKASSSTSRDSDVYECSLAEAQRTGVYIGLDFSHHPQCQKLGCGRRVYGKDDDGNWGTHCCRTCTQPTKKRKHGRCCDRAHCEFTKWMNGYGTNAPIAPEPLILAQRLPPPPPPPTMPAPALVPLPQSPPPKSSPQCETAKASTALAKPKENAHRRATTRPPKLKNRPLSPPPSKGKSTSYVTHEENNRRRRENSPELWLPIWQVQDINRKWTDESSQIDIDQERKSYMWKTKDAKRCQLCQECRSNYRRQCPKCQRLVAPGCCWVYPVELCRARAPPFNEYPYQVTRDHPYDYESTTLDSDNDPPSNNGQGPNGNGSASASGSAGPWQNYTPPSQIGSKRGTDSNHKSSGSSHCRHSSTWQSDPEKPTESHARTHDRRSPKIRRRGSPKGKGDKRKFEEVVGTDSDGQTRKSPRETPAESTEAESTEARTRSSTREATSFRR